MDWQFLRSELQGWDIELFKLGQTEISVSSLLKLVVLSALLFLVAGRLSRWTMTRLLEHAHVDPGTRSAAVGLVHYAVLVAGTVIILQNAGINLTAFAVVASALGVGVGFGLQNIISNFISGVIIMFERPIRVGDRIAILVPSQRFITDNVTNYVHCDREIRVRAPVSVAQGSDVRLVELLVWYDGQAHSRQDVLSAVYFAVADALRPHEIKTAG